MTESAAGARCRALNAEGERCGQATSVDPHSGLCLWHDPAREPEAKAARVRGGEHNTRQRVTKTVSAEDAPAPPKTLEDAKEWLSWVIHAVATGVIDTKTASVISYSVTAFRGVIERSEFETRLKTLEQRQADLEKSPRRVA